MIFYLVWLAGLIDRIAPGLYIVGGMLTLYFLAVAMRQFVRVSAVEVIEIYSRMNAARLDVAERDSELQAKIAAFQARMESDRLRLADQKAALKSGLPLTINERFARGEFDVEIE